MESPPPAESPMIVILEGFTGRWRAPSGGRIKNKSEKGGVNVRRYDGRMDTNKLQ